MEKRKVGIPYEKVDMMIYTIYMYVQIYRYRHATGYISGEQF